MNSINITKSIPVVGKYDVVVCGGGPSGWVAATAAARSGRRTALIERFGFLGGAQTACFVVPISGFFKNGERVVGGIAWEYVERLIADGAAQVEMPKGHVSVDTEYCKLESQRMVLEAGVDMYTNSYISGAVREGSRISAVYFENKNGTEALEGSYFVDATGDGDLCAAAGVPMIVPTSPQPLSFCFELSGVDVTTPLLRDCIHHNGYGGKPSCNAVIHDYLDSLYREGKAPMFGGPWFNTLLNGDRLIVNVTRNPASVLDNRAYAKAECAMREDIFRIVEILREKFPEFRNCVISGTPANAGVREGRHLIGLHCLTGDEVLSAVNFPDSIARVSHPMDVHRITDTEQTLVQLAKAGYVPYRSLVSADCDNLTVGGRIFSADDMAHATARVQATAMAIGEAAGRAAALCAADGTPVQQLDTELLRRTLLENGAVL